MDFQIYINNNLSISISIVALERKKNIGLKKE